MVDADPGYKQRLGDWARELRDRAPRRSWRKAALLTGLILGDGSELGAESLRKWAAQDLKEPLNDATLTLARSSSRPSVESGIFLAFNIQLKLKL